MWEEGKNGEGEGGKGKKNGEGREGRRERPAVKCGKKIVSAD